MPYLNTITNKPMTDRDWATDAPCKFVLCPSAVEMLKVARDLSTDSIKDSLLCAAAGGYPVGDDIGEYLPSCFSSSYTPELVERFISTLAPVTEKLIAGDELACTAEELAGHALINYALEYLNDDQDMRRESGVADPDAAREDLTELREEAFQDDDVLLLFNPRMDGIEDSPVATKLGMVNLHVNDWFKPFQSAPELYPAPTPTA